MPREEDGWGSSPEVLCGLIPLGNFQFIVPLPPDIQANGQRVGKSGLVLPPAQASADQRVNPREWGGGEPDVKWGAPPQLV